MKARRFRVAFSFAGEYRGFVAKVARILADEFGEAAILYDKFHEAELGRHDLGIYLSTLYAEESDLIVPVLCPNYDQKRWTGWEWLQIYGVLTKAEGYRVMPCRFGHASVDGLSPAAGFVELDHKTPEEAARLILERLAINEGRPRNYETDAAEPSETVRHTAIPNNLPRLQPFFGREDELGRIAEALHPDSRTWGVLIDGPGGMGKTSLAVRAGYDCDPSQFQRIVFVSVKDRELDDDGARELGIFILPGFTEMLNELAREVGHPGIANAPVDHRVRLLLDALRPAEALLILDNLESLPKADRDQLFTFVKRLPQGCKAICTSRRRIGSGSEELILEQLSQDAALQTLADLAQRNKLLEKTSENERIALYKATGGKPLLLRWLAGQLGRGSCRTFSDALSFLHSCPPENDPLEFVFGDLAREFTDVETRALVALTYFGMPIKLKHICALAEPLSPAEELRLSRASKFGTPDPEPDTVDSEEAPSIVVSEGEVRAALRSLANRSLVVPDQEEQAFALVPLVADFLGRNRPEIVAETGDRLEKRAFALAVENGYGFFDCFPVLDDSWPTVCAALPRFVCGPNGQLQTACRALRTYLFCMGRWDEAISLSEQAENKAVLEGDFQNACERAIEAGRIYEARRQAEPIFACAKRAEAHCKCARVTGHLLAGAIHLRGHGHLLAGDRAAAIATFHEALELRRASTPLKKAVAQDLCCLADAEVEAGDNDAAQFHYHEALRVAAAVGGGPLQAYIKGRMATSALRSSDWAQAGALALAALSEMERINWLQYVAVNCHTLANALAQQAKQVEALAYARRAVEIYSSLRSPELEMARQTLRKCEASSTTELE
jgi:tetratricopeptide (TPR) repeat protein